ncbi:hypothetical protein R5W23_005582 [Gemmata sp. JC673]|uniref:DUF4384 domain-containing protein n=1 Tax=Gemmata algarum TaxID=2975278 RepID=A0ABU5EVH7_9BACT|nr:hypothetical protein [Gemmata algarum]MDY3558465.1 hypothetical protein [Gemmata algarum]
MKSWYLVPVLALALPFAPCGDVLGGPKSDPLGPKAYPPVYVPAEAPHGYLYQPAVDLRAVPRGDALKYAPRAGDVLLLSDPDPLFTALYVIARSGRPGHSAVVITMPDGRLGVLESGFSFTPWTRITPLDYRLNLYSGHIWVRPRQEPLTAEQDRKLTEFALAAEGGKYDLRKFGMQLTLFRARNPLVTRFAGKPVGPGQKYVCVQIVLEALVYAGLIDAETTRPGATYSQDLFYDRSRNPYIDRHPPLAGRGWGPPQLWTPIPGTALRGQDRPQPPSAWPGPGGAYRIDPIPVADGQPPVPTVVGYVPGTPDLTLPTQSPPRRISFFDRPYRIFSRR